MRVLLSGVAIYPAPAVTTAAASVPAAKVSPLVLAPSDYNGTWDAGNDTFLDLTVKGNNPDQAKVKGTITSGTFGDVSVKFKGKISNSIELEGKFKTKLTIGPLTAKVQGELSVHLTDSTHFEGTASGSVNGIPQPPAPIVGVKL